nr:retrotransposon protein, putative, Ty1-copia subclass [Tanacetum cinerariifolium]
REPVRIRIEVLNLVRIDGETRYITVELKALIEGLNKAVELGLKCVHIFCDNKLLNSTDLRAFEKCVSCMFGKRERKPYTHQVERAKDLLRLIHTNVCGPFKIISREGANFFVTFIDDFSRYGYVYLLKHKLEVFETFKVFQKEVENQLGKTIKSLRSDRAGRVYESRVFGSSKGSWDNRPSNSSLHVTKQ